MFANSSQKATKGQIVTLEDVQRARFRTLLKFNGGFLLWVLLTSFGLIPLDPKDLSAITNLWVTMSSVIAASWMIGMFQVMSVDNQAAGLFGIRQRSMASAALIVLAMLCYCAGNVWNAINLVLNRPQPFPSPATWMVVAMYPIMACAISLLPGRSMPKLDRMRIALDSAVMVVTVAMFYWYFHLGPTIFAQDSTGLAPTVRAMFPLGGLMMLASLVVVSARPFDRSQWVFRVGMLVSVLIWVAIDGFAYKTMLTGASLEGFDVLRVGRSLALMLIAMSFGSFAIAKEGEQKPPKIKIVFWRSILPYVLVVPVLGLIVAIQAEKITGPVVVGVYACAAVLTCLIFARQLLSIHQNLNLNNKLNDALEVVTQKNAEIQEYAFKVSAQYQELIAMQKQLEHSHREIAAKNVELVANQKQTQAFAERVDSTNKQLQETQDKLQDSYQRLSQKNSETEKYAKRLEVLNNELNQTKSELESNLRHQEVLNQDLRSTKTELIESNEALADLNELLLKQATTDAMTGLPNHGAFQEQLRNELTNFTITGRHVSLLLIDVDYFKHYNDTYGHPAGDAALIRVAMLLAEEVRACDFIARYGGEEFAVIMPNTNSYDSVAMAERIRAKIEGTEFACRWVTVSIGVSGTDTVGCEPTLLVEAADYALYRAKNEGRNRHVLFVPNEPSTQVAA